MKAGTDRIRSKTGGRMPYRAARCWVWMYRSLATPPLFAVISIILEYSGVPTTAVVVLVLIVVIWTFASYFIGFHVGVSSVVKEYGFRRRYARGIFASYRRGPDAFDEMWEYVQSKPDRFVSS